MSEQPTFKEFVLRVPWITRLDKAVPCQGLKSHTPLKAVYSMGGKPPVGLAPYACKNPGYWKFEALNGEPQDIPARSGVYCWSHLLSRGLFASVAEETRFNEWLAKDKVVKGDFDKKRAQLIECGYTEIDCYNEIRVGSRVRHSGERWFEARRNGTATVLAVMQKHESSWARRHGQPDVEVLVDKDKPLFSQAPVEEWAGYYTVPASPIEL